MTLAHRPARYTLEEYVRIENSSNLKHEYFDGRIFAMGGGTPEHGLRAARVIASLTSQLRGKRCNVYTSDVRIRVVATGLVTYPDALVVCGAMERDAEDRLALTNPVVVVEVLSPGTEAYDRGDKLAHYQTIPSLHEVVLVCHDRRWIEVWQRERDGWRAIGSAGSVELPSIGCILDVGDVFADPLAG